MVVGGRWSVVGGRRSVVVKQVAQVREQVEPSIHEYGYGDNETHDDTVSEAV